MHRFTHIQQGLMQFPAWLLTGTDNNSIDGQATALFRAGNMQPFIINKVVTHTVEHFHATHG
ncbi:Uncharacterised protein [Yersinia enterocolitica]|nr:Uncharacterised protein [Yersinia enterocolitica]